MRGVAGETNVLKAGVLFTLTGNPLDVMSRLWAWAGASWYFWTFFTLVCGLEYCTSKISGFKGDLIDFDCSGFE